MRQGFDNFKEEVESAIISSGARFIFFSTDDQYVFAPTVIPQVALERIASDPDRISLKLNVSDSLGGKLAIPSTMRIERIPYVEGEFNGMLFQWDADERGIPRFWEYSFSVDFQVYESKSLLRLIASVLYHIPTTLEQGGLRDSRRRKMFRSLLGTANRTVAGMQLNVLQPMVDNIAKDFSPDALKMFYEHGWRLTVLDDQLPSIDWHCMPDELYFYQVGSSMGTLVEYKELLKNFAT